MTTRAVTRILIRSSVLATLASLAALAALASCARPADSRTQSVVLGLERGTLRLVGTGPEVAALAATPAEEGAPAIDFELRDAQGQLVASGATADPRAATVEMFGDQGPSHVAAQMALTRIDLPQVAGELRLIDPQQGAEVGRVHLPGAGGRQRRITLADDSDVVGPPVLVGGDGDAATSVTILVLPEAYTGEQLDQFREQTAALVASFRQVQDISPYWNQIRVLRQDVRSPQSEIDDSARENLFETAFEVRRSQSSGSLGFATSRGHALTERLARQAGADVAALLVNATKGRSAAGQGVVFLRSGRMDSGHMKYAGSVLAHELGHALLGLGDEYEEAAKCDPETRLHYPNIASAAARHLLPWADLVGANTPLPTPLAWAKAQLPHYVAEPFDERGRVGAYEGALYCKEGFYRPAVACLMRGLARFMCPVCRRELDRYMAQLRDATTPRDSCSTGDAWACGDSDRFCSHSGINHRCQPCPPGRYNCNGVFDCEATQPCECTGSDPFECGGSGRLCENGACADCPDGRFNCDGTIGCERREPCT